MLEARNKKFYLDGKEFRIKSGAFHYFRALPEYWEDILKKIKAAGLNTVESYTCWNLHEPHKGEFNFSGMLDLERFIETADKVGLKVILRTGPFICAEWENGGIPAWLLKRELNVTFRCNTPEYLGYLRDWFSVLLGKIRPHLDTNGGNVIALAVENEYGSFGDDFSYLAEVEKIYRDNGIDCMLVAADGSSEYYLSTGRSGNHIIAGTDFGGNGTIERLNNVDVYDKDAPYFALEYWAGNFTDWGFPQCTHDDITHTKTTMKLFNDTGASFNIYMLFGGTNFGFLNGAQCNSGGYKPVTTSYDYDAAITEWGGYTERYFVIKGDDETPVPPSPVLQNIGEVRLTKSASLWDNLNIGKSFKTVAIKPMEEFDQSYGFILYKKVMDYNGEVNCIKMTHIRDRAHVFVNGELKAVCTRGTSSDKPVFLDEKLKKGDVIEILVENMGRVCFGEETYLGDRKGITESVVLTWHDGTNFGNPGKTTFNWEVTTLEMEDISSVSYKEGTDERLPAFFRGTFRAKNKNSCFVHFDNFKKGVIWVNGFNLGRYWEIGPLEALYIPGVLLKEDEENEIVIFETDGLRGEPAVTISDVCGIPNHHEEIIVK